MSVPFDNGETIRFNERELRIESELGSGAFGTVYKVFDTKRRTDCALKVIEYRNLSNKKRVMREIDTIKKVSSSRIIQYFDYVFWQKQSSFLILTEFCAGGDLNSRLNMPSSIETNLKWVMQLSEALSYLHTRTPAILHRDLKADNVLLTKTQDVKLGDFGLAREYVALKNIGPNPDDMVEYYMASGYGPIHWVAPEFFQQRYTEKADIFSLGGIFYAIFSRDWIVVSSEKMYGVFAKHLRHEKVGLGYAMAHMGENAKEKPLQISFQGSESLKCLIRSMLDYATHNRPSATEVNKRARKILASYHSNKAGDFEGHGDVDIASSDIDWLARSDIATGVDRNDYYIYDVDDNEEYCLPDDNNDSCDYVNDDDEEYCLPDDNNDSCDYVDDDDEEYCLPDDNNDSCDYVDDDDEEYCLPDDNNDSCDYVNDDDEEYCLPDDNNDSCDYVDDDDEEYCLPDDNNDSRDYVDDDDEEYSLPDDNNDSCDYVNDDDEEYSLPDDNNDSYDYVDDDDEEYCLPDDNNDSCDYVNDDDEEYCLPDDNNDSCDYVNDDDEEY